MCMCTERKRERGIYKASPRTVYLHERQSGCRHHMSASLKPDSRKRKPQVLVSSIVKKSDGIHIMHNLHYQDVFAIKTRTQHTIYTASLSEAPRHYFSGVSAPPILSEFGGQAYAFERIIIECSPT